jgi:hypothetical protein
MKKTFRIGDLVCYDDDFVKARNIVDDGQFVGTIVGWSKASDGSRRAKIHWFDWFKTGPTETVEYFSEIQLISGER